MDAISATAVDISASITLDAIRNAIITYGEESTIGKKRLSRICHDIESISIRCQIGYSLD